MLNYILKIPEGFSEGMYHGKKYGVNKETFNAEKSFKIYGKELQGNNFISLNYYITSRQEVLKPCEMPEEKVIDFLKNVRISNKINT